MSSLRRRRNWVTHVEPCSQLIKPNPHKMQSKWFNTIFVLFVSLCLLYILDIVVFDSFDVLSTRRPGHPCPSNNSTIPFRQSIRPSISRRQNLTDGVNNPCTDQSVGWWSSELLVNLLADPNGGHRKDPGSLLRGCGGRFDVGKSTNWLDCTWLRKSVVVGFCCCRI